MPKPTREVLDVMVDIRAENIKRIKLSILELENDIATFEKIQQRSFETMAKECPYRTKNDFSPCRHDNNTYANCCSIRDCPLLDLFVNNKIYV